MAAFALLGPLLTPDPAAQHLARALQPPGPRAWFGTDQFGRSVAARVAQAASRSLGSAFICVICAAAMGTAFGLIAAWTGDWRDRAFALAADGTLAIPPLLLVLLVAAFAPTLTWPIYLGLALTLWVGYFRVVRARTAGVLRSAPVEASRLLAFRAPYIARRHVMPAILGLVLVLMTYDVAVTVLAVAALGFIGVGVHPPAADLGQLMTDGLPQYREAPWIILAPVALLLVTVAGLALVAENADSR